MYKYPYIKITRLFKSHFYVLIKKNYFRIQNSVWNDVGTAMYMQIESIIYLHINPFNDQHCE